MLGEKHEMGAVPVQQADGALGAGGAEPGRPVGDILEEMERVLGERQELVLRLEAMAGDQDKEAARDRAAIRQELACYAGDIDRCMAELGMIKPPEGPSLV